MLKLLVEVDLSKPLLRGTKLKLEQELVWVDFRYEILPTFCFCCEVVGHQEKNCDKKVKDPDASRVREGQYGNWLRVQSKRERKKGGEPITMSRKQVELGKEVLELTKEQQGNRKIYGMKLMERQEESIQGYDRGCKWGWGNQEKEETG